MALERKTVCWVFRLLFKQRLGRHCYPGLCCWRRQLSLRGCVRGSGVFLRLRRSEAAFEGQWIFVLLTICLARSCPGRNRISNLLMVCPWRRYNTLLFGLIWLTPAQHQRILRSIAFRRSSPCHIGGCEARMCGPPFLLTWVLKALNYRSPSP